MQKGDENGIYMQKIEIFMGKMLVLLIIFSKFATELINKTTRYEHDS